ncbi:MAG: hypothetical protein NC411_10460 [Bacteroides sp.]|nr:hypothetical protein [Bacteroides sp.]
MPDNNPVKSKRDLTMERMKAKYPDRVYDDDEALFGQINDDYEDYDRQLATSREHERAFSEMFYKNPKAARLMMEWKDGKDPVASLISIYGKEDILAAIDDPEKLQAIEDANKEFAEKLAKSDEYDEQYNKNFPESARAIDEWASQNGIDDETVNGIGTMLAEICGNFIVGKFTPRIFEMLLKAKNYESDIEKAQTEGEVVGRNAKIKETLRSRKNGDGTVALDGKNGKVNSSPKRDLGALERFGDRQSIFERGGEKRTAKR